MKTDVFELSQSTQNLEGILTETEKAAQYGGLDSKQTIRLRLLAEELIGMLPEMLEYCSGKFWVECNKKDYELHVEVELDDIFAADREKLMSVSKSGKNIAAKGIMGKIRAAAEMMFVEYMTLPVEYQTDFYSMGMAMDPFDYASMWTLSQYRTVAEEKDEDKWDELEKSIIANLADDVMVGIKGRKVDIIVKKSFD
ncbi:MAG: hypothetical protein IJR59_02355 [Firmicutes bacterium]|nr:hypothetical protein [Bacillota bacterium]